MTSTLETMGLPRSRERVKITIFAAKLVVSGACFWYVMRQIDLPSVARMIPLLDMRWLAVAGLGAMLQIPLVGLRWHAVLHALNACGTRTRRTALVLATAIGQFFAQALPNVAGDGIRAWLVVRLGCDWRNAVTSVVIDRGVGVGLLVALSFAIMLVPSSLPSLEAHRVQMLTGFGAMLLIGLVALALTPRIAPVLQQWRRLEWIATFAAATHRVLLGPRSGAILGIGCVVHALTIVAVWALAQALGLALTFGEAAVLFTVMVGIALVPISIGGWGLRELTVVSLLHDYGIAPERALLFSVSFGVLLIVASLPGAAAWLLYSYPQPGLSSERGA